MILAPWAGKLRSAVTLVCRRGVAGALREARRQMWSTQPFLVLYSRLPAKRGRLVRDLAICVSRARPQDAPEICAHWPPEFSSTRSPDEIETVVRQRFAEGMPCFVARANDRFAGAMWADRQPILLRRVGLCASPSECEVRNLFIVPSLRGRGAGCRLLAGALDLLRQDGFDGCYALVFPWRAASIATHTRAGFAPLGTLYQRWRFGRMDVRFQEARGGADRPRGEAEGAVHLRQSPSGATPAVVCDVDGPNSIGLVRALGQFGVPVYFLRQDASRAGFVHRSRFCKGVFEVGSDGSIAGALRRVAQGLGVRPILFCGSDQAVRQVAENYEALSQCYHLPMPPAQTLLDLLDKDALHETAMRMGMPLPETHLFSSLEEARDLAPRLAYPVIVKPVRASEMGQAQFKTLRASGSGEFLRQVEAVLEGRPTLVVQHYIPGGDDNVLVFLGASGRDGRLIAACTGRKIRQYPPGAGIAASAEVCDLPEVWRLSERLLNAVGYVGLSGVEFKRDPDTGQLYFIEVSARTESFHSLAMVGGYNLPAIVYADTFGLPQPRLPERPRKGKWVWFLLDVRSALHEIRAGRLRLFAYLRTFTGRFEWAILSRSDPMPWVASVLHLVVKALRRMVTGRFLGR